MRLESYVEVVYRGVPFLLGYDFSASCFDSIPPRVERDIDWRLDTKWSHFVNTPYSCSMSRNKGKDM